MRMLHYADLLFLTFSVFSEAEEKSLGEFKLILRETDKKLNAPCRELKVG